VVVFASIQPPEAYSSTGEQQTTVKLLHGLDLKKRASNAQAKIARTLGKNTLGYWKEKVFRPTYTRGGSSHQSPHYCVEIQYRGRRHRLSLETSALDAAASRARDIFLTVQSQGWDAALAKFRPNDSKDLKRQDLTVGELIGAVKATADGNPKTIEVYCRAFRKVVADIAGVDTGAQKYNCRGGGHDKWLSSVHSVRLATITPLKVQAWKRTFLHKAGTDAIKQRQAKISCNFFLRNIRSLFSKNILRHLDVPLPSPLPFEGVEFEPKQSSKYRSTFDIQALIKKAQQDLGQTQPEQFKIFLLASTVGLRRREIDLLEWTAFRWEQGVLRIEPTKYFRPKSEESISDLPLDPEVLQIFRNFREKAAGPFVIASSVDPRPGANYNHYRCEAEFQRLSAWLKQSGVATAKPIHCLRKEYGSAVNSKFGIHAASRALRHSDIRTSSAVYVDSQLRVSSGLGSILELKHH
jgi:integrase